MTDRPAGPPADADASPAPVLFEARLVPHRSLPPAAFTLLMSGVIVVAFTVGTVAVAFGAWPVTGFCGVELLLFYLLFRLNYRSAAAASESIRLTADRLDVVRRERSRETGRWSLQPYWITIVLAGEEGAGAVLLRSHGRTLAVGRFLAPAERLKLKDALALALARARESRFDQAEAPPRESIRRTPR